MIINNLKLGTYVDPDGYVSVIQDGEYYVGKFTHCTEPKLSILTRPLHEEFTNADISIVMTAAICPLNVAISSLQRTNGDIVDASSVAMEIIY